MNMKKKNIYERIINVILDIFICLFGVILLISIYNGIQVKILGNEYSSFFGYSIFEVQTGSMAETINIGDWIIVKSSNKILIDDIVTYEQDGEFITHRVKESYKGTYITKGDANNTKDDKPISQNQIVGRVVKILPHFGIFRKTIFNPGVLIALIITFYLFGFVFKKNRSNKKNEDSKNEITRKIDMMLEKAIKEIKKIFSYISEKKEKLLRDVKENKKIENQETKISEDKIKFEQISPEKENIDVTIEDTVIEEASEEDLDKTMYFRAIKVDKDELDNTFLEIAKNKEKENTEEEKEKERQDKLKEKKQREIPEKIDESLIKNNLEMLQNKNNKKYTNVIDKIMYIKGQELEEIITILNNGEKLLVNEATIKNEFIKTYIDVKYYNYCGNASADYNNRNMTVKIVDMIKEISEKMIDDYKGSDTKYADKVKKYTNIFILIMYLEQAKGEIDDIEPIREMYKKKIVRYSKSDNINDKNIKDMIDSIIKTQRVYKGMINYSLKKLETNTFALNYNQLSSKKNIYGLELNHNITFGKVYSDYIVDKTYSEGIIAEDKVMIVMSLLSIQLIKDMLSSDFRKKYILYIPASIYDKENKLIKLTKMMDDEFTKNNIYILVKYEELLNNKKVIKELRKMGYKFALVFDKTVEVKAKDMGNIYVADYIFIDKKMVDTANILPNIPEELINNIIYEDVGSKVGNYGGE